MLLDVEDLTEFGVVIEELLVGFGLLLNPNEVWELDVERDIQEIVGTSSSSSEDGETEFDEQVSELVHKRARKQQIEAQADMQGMASGKLGKLATRKCPKIKGKCNVSLSLIPSKRHKTGAPILGGGPSLLSSFPLAAKKKR
ncbi:hypothetical protein ACOSQ4_031518 [Xanthoceras sorbifolium]